MPRIFSIALPLFDVPLILGLFLSLSVGAATVSIAATAQVDRIEGQTIYFKGDTPPKPLKTELYDLVYVGTLKPPSTTAAAEAIPYFLFSGNPCPDCPQEKALYLIRPVSKAQITSFVYPGKVIDPKTHQIVLDSRAFVGQCLAKTDGSDQYVVFQKERVDHRRGHRIEASVFVAQASPDYLREKLVDRNIPRLARTLTFVKSKRCSEIPGHNRVMPLKPRGLDWHSLKQEDDEDVDEPENESPSGAPADTAGPSGG